jgi:hypothetical protein
MAPIMRRTSVRAGTAALARPNHPAMPHIDAAPTPRLLGHSRSLGTTLAVLAERLGDAVNFSNKI